MATGGSLSGSKAARREAGHSLPSMSEVKSAWNYTATPQYVFMALCLIKQGQFYFKQSLL
jgi:hypothetical protein